MTVKSFTTAGKSVEANQTPLGEPLSIELDGREITFTPPTTGQWAVTMAGGTDTSSPSDMIATQINFFFGMLDTDDVNYFRHRLFDREDPFDVDNITEIIEYLIEEWSARPTKQPSDFLPSQSNGGKRSTAVRRHVASTPSA